MTVPSKPTRIDYGPEDLDAPMPTSRVPGAAVIVTNEDGHVLMIRRSDSGRWALPGGAHEIGESLPDTAIRECLEETGVEIVLTGLVGTFTDPRNVLEYRTDRPEVRQEFSVVYTGQPVGGFPHPTSEALDVAWIPPEDLSGLDTTKAIANRLQAWKTYASRQAPHIG